MDTIGVAKSEGTALRRELRREVQRRQNAQPSASKRVDRALAKKGDGPGSCGDSASCLARVGREVPADLVLASTLAGLGEMRLVRTRLVRSKDGLMLHDFQETVQRGPESLNHYAAELTRRLFPDRLQQRWYKKWWIWSAIAAAVGASVGVTWWLATRNGQEPDPNVVRLGDL